MSDLVVALSTSSTKTVFLARFLTMAEEYVISILMMISLKFCTSVLSRMAIFTTFEDLEDHFHSDVNIL